MTVENLISIKNHDNDSETLKCVKLYGRSLVPPKAHDISQAFTNDLYKIKKLTTSSSKAGVSEYYRHTTEGTRNN
jgi:hypothetical protein